MILNFHKFQGTGNDFIMVDNFSGKYDNLSVDLVRKLCDRRFGIGADGLIVLHRKEGYDFEMDYFNSDGSKSFCGNGARCSVAFAFTLGLEKEHFQFWAIDGAHEAFLEGENIGVKMKNCEFPIQVGDDYFLDTGSPHYLVFQDNLTHDKVMELGRKIRYSETYKLNGVNVNLIKAENERELSIATYERGVENETLSCGTGATACALLHAHLSGQFKNEIFVNVKGGKLSIRFEKTQDRFENIWLIGPAKMTFRGEATV
jgi:diaminopimelate epimerase